jgi:hypothetical protein
MIHAEQYARGGLSRQIPSLDLSDSAEMTVFIIVMTVPFAKSSTKPRCS